MSTRTRPRAPPAQHPPHASAQFLAPALAGSVAACTRNGVCCTICTHPHLAPSSTSVFYAVPRATIYVSRPHFGIGEVDRNIENASLEPEQMKTTEEYFTQRRRPNLYDSETMYLGQYG